MHWAGPRELWRWKADLAPGRLWSRAKSQDSQAASRICSSMRRKVQNSLNCHRRKGSKEGEEADVPAEKGWRLVLGGLRDRKSGAWGESMQPGHRQAAWRGRGRLQSWRARGHLTFWSTMEQAISRTCARL